jgi:hypothetical protein
MNEQDYWDMVNEGQGDGYTNEYQRASAQARIEHQSWGEAEWQAVKRALARDMVVVVRSMEAYGPFDEVIGEDHQVAEYCYSQEEAAAYISALDSEDLAAFRYSVLPEQVTDPVAAIVVATCEDDIPF